MWQDLLRIPLPFDVPIFGKELVIHGFGLMLVIGFLAAMELSRYLARRKGLNPEFFANAALIGLVAGIIGARLSHVIENLGEYTNPARTFGENFRDAINLTSGGLTYYGGFLLAFPTCAAYAIYKKIPLRLGMDIVAPCLMVGLGFGRVGCFLNGCCFGATCDVPWAVSFPYGSPPYVEHVSEGKIDPPSQLFRRDANGGAHLIEPSKLALPSNEALRPLAAKERSLRVHPAQLYSAVTALTLAGLLVSFLAISPPPGRVFALMLILEGAARYTLELLRVEPPVIGNMSLSMVLSVGIVFLGVILWIAFHRRGTTDPAPVETNAQSAVTV